MHANCLKSPASSKPRETSRRWTPRAAKQLYKIAQEAVTNAIKHGKAKQVAISLAQWPELLMLTVQNNGLPFPDLKGQSSGMGLRIMNYRASLIGGSVLIKANGSKGTLLTCSIPLDPKSEHSRQTAA